MAPACYRTYSNRKGSRTFCFCHAGGRSYFRRPLQALVNRVPMTNPGGPDMRHKSGHRLRRTCGADVQFHPKSNRSRAAMSGAPMHFGSTLWSKEFAPALGTDSSVHQGARCGRHEVPATAATLSVVRVVLVARGRLWNLRCLALCADRQQPGSYTSTAYDDTAPGKHRRGWIGIYGVGHFITQAASFL